MAIYRVKDQTIHVVEKGHPNRQVAMLIHGWSSSSFAMSPLIDHLSQRFRCLAVDLPGYGNSPRLPEKTTIIGYADILAELAMKVHDGPIVLIGHSMGGMISLVMAERYPEIIERLVLICPTITGNLSSYINLFVSPVTMLEQFSPTRFISNMVERAVVGLTDILMRPASFAERTGITLDDYYKLRGDARRPDQGKVRAECYWAMRESDLSERVGSIMTPALVIWGAEDNTVPLRDAGVVADEWPDADLRIIPKAGHWPHFERPEATQRMIASFLGLPLFKSNVELQDPDVPLDTVTEIANFLSHSDVGSNLNLTQRTRLAAQLDQRKYDARQTIVKIRDIGNEMFIIQDGTVEVWYDPDNPGEVSNNLKMMATLRPGQITGELSLFDEGLRSANLVAGEAGATILALHRQVAFAMCEDDPDLGARFLWNMSRALSHRVRFIQWQFRRATQQASSSPVMRRADRTATRPSLTSYNGKFTKSLNTRRVIKR
ncbi:MAG: alpha/beta fold hydrolase [Chloroflexota bacterium]